MKTDSVPWKPRAASYLIPEPVAADALLEELDLAYRTLCAILYNFAPASGHPGGSISSGRIAQALAFDTLDYDVSDPGRREADSLCYAAGHKALGLYALWALRNECVRIAWDEALPAAEQQLRLEDLLGFRRNPVQNSGLFQKLRVKHLDGHPTPATPWVPLATGASGVGLGAAVGMALGQRDYYGEHAPKVHVIEGEGGLTPGRVAEALAAASRAGLGNLMLHVDWNQSSIDSDKVCAEDGEPGDYVAWDPCELLYLHGWNVLWVPTGLEFTSILGAQQSAARMDNGRPTAVVYRTTKGWRYGIEGKASHGTGHPFCSEGYFGALENFERRFNVKLPRPERSLDEGKVEGAYYETLLAFRTGLENMPQLAGMAVDRLKDAAHRLAKRARLPRAGAPRIEELAGLLDPNNPPQPLRCVPGKNVALRHALGQALGWLNSATGGALMGSAADLLDSTSLSQLNAGFPDGFYHARKNAGSRLVAAGGICEDGMGAIMSGLSGCGRHIGVTSSYSAFIAALEHVPARLHAIGQLARRAATGKSPRTWIMVNAHAGPMTGEDGPTHADPQALQLLQDNFPAGALITLTPWEPQEVWPLLAAGLAARPALLCPFVARPAEPVPDRAALGLPGPEAVAQGVYAVRRSPRRVAVALQGSAVATVFFREVLPKLDRLGNHVNVFYIASAELFDRLPAERREEIFPTELRKNALGITDFTWTTLMRWLGEDPRPKRCLHPFRNDRFLGSGRWDKVLAEGGLGGDAQWQAVEAWMQHHWVVDRKPSPVSAVS